MARIPFVDPAALPEAFRDLPMEQNFQRVYANSPSGTRAFMGTTGEIRKRSGLPPRLRELAVLQIGYTAKSAYVFTHHVKAGLAAGVAPDDIRALADPHADAPGRFSPLERAVIELARDMTAGAVAPEATFATVRRALGEGQLMDLLFVIAHYIGMAVLLRTLQIELEDSYKAYLTEYPLAFAPAGG